MQDKITIADAPDCLNTNDKAMWVLGYQAALEARSTCPHQIQEPAAAEQAAWHAGLDEGRAQAGFTVSNEETSQTAPAAVAVPDERAAFEKWASFVGYSIKRWQADANLYEDNGTEDAWIAWQARAALAATPAAAPLYAEMLTALQAVGMDVVSVGGGENTISDAARAKVDAVLVKAGVPWADRGETAAAPVVLPEPDAYMDSEDAHRVGTSSDWVVTGDMRAPDDVALYTASTVRALLATATGLPAQGVPAFCHVASLKLRDLQERGYQITGYALEKPVEGAQPERGFINHGGFVGWWWDGQSPLVQPGALDVVTQAVRDYYFALDTRQHGGAAASTALDAIQKAFGLSWVQGAEASARAAQAAQGGE